MPPIKILVVDDELDMKTLILGRFREQIQAGRFQFYFAYNGCEALSLLHEQAGINVVLTDIRMPVMDGLTLLEHLRKKYPLVCPLVVTAYTDYNNMRMAMKLGAHDIIEKPVDFTKLEIVLEKTHRHICKIINHSAKRRQAEEALQRSERQLRHLVEKIPAGIAILQEERLVFVNDALGRILGKSCEQLLRSPPECIMQHIRNQDNHSTALIQYIPDAKTTLWLHVQQEAFEWESQPAQLLTIEDVTEEKRQEAILRKEVHVLKDGLKDRYRLGNIIGKSAAMQRVYEKILKAAESDESVLILGESGTGKELVATTIHQLSARSEQAFVTVNCGAITPTLFERELFGHCKGAFTDATRDQAGYLDAAHQGVLFLDEVGELTTAQQVKLLRVLQTGEYTPVGANTAKRVDVRIMAATHRDIHELVKTGAMREDFFYRLHVIDIVLPPLRERKDDLPLLIEHFLKKAMVSDSPVDFPGDLLEQAYTHNWPGNVRELYNALRRYTAMDFLALTNFGRRSLSFDTEQMLSGEEWQPRKLDEAIGAFEKDFIRRMLDFHNGNRTKTAATLGITVRTLQRHMKKYHIS